jgi:multicomponent Na+:H+ antiporter subunit A
MLIWIVSLPFIAAVAAPWAHRLLRGWAGPVFALVPLAICGATLRELPLAPGEARTVAFTWVPGFGVQWAFQLDGLAAIFVLLIAGIGALVVIYAGGYLSGDRRCGLFFAYLLAFMGAMLGVVLSDDLITLFVFWELTSFSSFLLIGYYHEKEDSRDAALQALLVTSGGGLALLAGLLLLSFAAQQMGVSASEALRVSTLAEVDIRGHGLYPAVLILILCGAFTKSALVPFHFWLPTAMVAPTPVSAYLHSATMVKAGVYLLARLHPVLGDTLWWQIGVSAAGAVTMLTAATLALGHRDLKRILAYTTVSVLGMLVMLLGLGTELAIKAAVTYLVAHALYKAALFLVAGNVDHETGTRDVSRLSGLGRVMPLTAAAALLAAFSKAGLPPFLGFIGKEEVYHAAHDVGIIWILAAVLASVALVGMALVVAIWPFFGARRDTPRKPHEAPVSMLLGPGLLALAGLALGLAPGMFGHHVGSAAASAIAGQPLKMDLALWHGFNPESLLNLALSAVTLVLGVVLFLKLRRWLPSVGEWIHRAAGWGPASGYARLLTLFYRFANAQTRVLQSGYLRRYLLILSMFVIVLVSPILIGGIGAVFTNSRLAAVALLGTSGLGIALYFALFGAPELAITQIMIEALTVIVFVLVFHHLPAVTEHRSWRQQLRDGFISLAVGTMMAVLLMAVATVESEPVVARYFAEVAYPEAHGRNIVNVILVDFRALDTLGEIAVLAVAGIGVYTLLRLRPERPGEERS